MPHRSFWTSLFGAGVVTVLTMLIAWSTLSWGALFVGALAGGVFGFFSYDPDKVRAGLKLGHKIFKENLVHLREVQIRDYLKQAFSNVRPIVSILMFITRKILLFLSVSFTFSGVLFLLGYDSGRLLSTETVILSIASFAAAELVLGEYALLSILCGGKFNFNTFAKWAFGFDWRNLIMTENCNSDPSMVVSTTFFSSNTRHPGIRVAAFLLIVSSIPHSVLIGVVDVIVGSFVVIRAVLAGIRALFVFIHSTHRVMVAVDGPLGGVAAWLIAASYVGGVSQLLELPMIGLLAAIGGGLLSIAFGYVNVKFVAPLLNTVPQD